MKREEEVIADSCREAVVRHEEQTSLSLVLQHLLSPHTLNLHSNLNWVGKTRREPLKYLLDIDRVHRGRFKGERGQGLNQGHSQDLSQGLSQGYFLARGSLFPFSLPCSLDHNQDNMLPNLTYT